MNKTFEVSEEYKKFLSDNVEFIPVKEFKEKYERLVAERREELRLQFFKLRTILLNIENRGMEYSKMLSAIKCLVATAIESERSLASIKKGFYDYENAKSDLESFWNTNLRDFCPAGSVE